MPLGMEVGLGPGDFVLDGAPPQNGAEPPPQFSAHFYYGQTAGCIMIPLGMEVGLSRGNFVLDGDPSPPQKGGGAPLQFSAHVYCSQTVARINMPLGTEVGLSPDDIVLDRDPAPLPQKGGRSPFPNFWPTFILAKRLDGSTWHSAWRWALVQATLW